MALFQAVKDFLLDLQFKKFKQFKWKYPVSYCLTSI